MFVARNSLTRRTVNKNIREITHEWLINSQITKLKQLPRILKRNLSEQRDYLLIHVPFPLTGSPDPLIHWRQIAGPPAAPQGAHVVVQGEVWVAPIHNNLIQKSDENQCFYYHFF